VVFGGVGNLWARWLAGLTLGNYQISCWNLWVGAVLAKILVLVMIIPSFKNGLGDCSPRKARADAEGLRHMWLTRTFG